MTAAASASSSPSSPSSTSSKTDVTRPMTQDDRAPHGLTDRFLAFRDRKVSDPKFQRWAAETPLVRQRAKARARDLFDIVSGFVYSQVLLATVRLKLCEILADGPISVPALANRLAMTEDATRRLLDATTVLELTARRSNDRFGLGELGAALLGTPGLAALIEHHAMFYKDLEDPVALLRGHAGETNLSRYWSYARSEDAAAESGDAVAEYSELMSTSQEMIADDILAAFPPTGVKHWMDLGGGEGVFGAAVARKGPHAKVTVFDLPAVAERARERLKAAGLGDRVQAVGGDFRSGDLPKGVDVVSLVRVIHDHDDDVALEVLRAARQALVPGGRLVIAEQMAGTRGAEPLGGAYFGFYLLAMGSGRPRTPEALRWMVERVGFRDVVLPRTRQPLLTRLLVARAPDAPGQTARS
ncbi:demethylspheroidene O-methyltransferase [Rhodospira trueperi]|uniref:Demethylspheroidene O-methyltransferase n=2 Tax=Rhodospira trueperi TaxID=69960 RepID=A0A1G6ZW40_9PROT|nr:demethylspheroidene O-methyltransferase [Rhodospira trueperi]